jgi:nicotinate-nucleotide adenylyltransferase
MLALAIQGRPDWSIDLEELDREPPSYTVDTLRAIQERHPGDELWLLMGTDILAGFARWRRPEEILKIARVAAFHREPFVGDRLEVPEVAGMSDRLSVFDAGSVKISATDIRNDLAAGKNIAGRVPGPVAEYITKHGLYKPGTPQR